jgi:ATP-binding cassette subfamily C protein
MKNLRLVGGLLANRVKANPQYVFQAVLLSLTTEARAIVSMFFPAVLLSFVMQPDKKSAALIIVLVVSLLLMLLDFLADNQEIRSRNHYMRMFHYWTLSLRNKAHSLSLIVAESMEGQRKLWRADEGVVDAINAVDVVFIVLLGRVISLIFTIYVFTSIHIFVALFVFTTVLATALLNRKRDKLIVELNQEIAALRPQTNYMEGTIFNLPVVRDAQFSGAASFLSSQYNDLMVKKRAVQEKMESVKLRYNTITVIITALRFVAIYGFAVLEYSNGQLPISDFLLFASAATLMGETISQILESYVDLARMAPRYKIIKEYLELPDYGDDEGSSVPAPTSIKEVIFENVSFTYPNRDKPALKNVSFILREGDIIALVGDNGAGKSTVIKLLLRLYPVTSGRILLNGCDIMKYDYSSYRSLFASAFQDYNIFNLTLRENLLFNEENERIIEYLSHLGLDKKIDSLPKGLDTQYSLEFEEDGVVFSGGEEQRLAIARALCKNGAAALTMDEPTASLDPFAEYELNQMVHKIRSEKFTLFVSHRFSTTRFCNRILVLDHGEIVEEGSHDELLKKKGLYSEMYDMQVAFFQPQK